MKTRDERIAAIEGIGGFSPTAMMGKGTLLPPDGFTALEYDGAVIGYDLRLGNLSYRGINTGTVEGIRLTVDGEPVDPFFMVFRIRQLVVPVANIGHLGDVMWGATDRASLTVYSLGGLAAGMHRIQIEIDKRADFGHSYGEGEQGWSDAIEFQKPDTFRSEAMYEI